MHITHLLPLISLAPVALATPIDARAGCTTKNSVSDGGFESGVIPGYSTAPWSLSELQGSTGYTLASPGKTGKYAFRVALAPDPYGPDSRLTLSQTLKTCPGQNYSITADLKFDSKADGKCAATIIYPFQTKRTSVTIGSGHPKVRSGQWIQLGAQYQGVTTADKISVVLTCGDRGQDVISVDNVEVKPIGGSI